MCPEQRDRPDGPVHRSEPVRGPRRKLHGFTGFDGEVLLAENQPQPAGEHVHPILDLVHRQFGGWGAAACTDPDLVRMQSACRTVASQRPVGDIVMGVRATPNAGILRLGRAQEFVGADRQGGGEPGEVVEGESALSRFQPASASTRRCSIGWRHPPASIRAAGAVRAASAGSGHRRCPLLLPAWQKSLAVWRCTCKLVA